MPKDIVEKLQDYTDLVWTERANSSGTGGTYLKARTGSGTRMTYYKLSRFNGVEIDGHECANEIIASRLMRILGIEHLEYRLVHANVRIGDAVYETWVNASINFRRPRERKQALGLFYELNRQPEESPYDFCVRMGWEENIKQMMLVDYLIMNRDRHESNIEVLVAPDGSCRLAPIFDNGLSLLAPLAGMDDTISSFDPLKRVATMNFIGSRDLEENLVSAMPIAVAGSLGESDRNLLLDGLDAVLPQLYRDKIWDIVWQRWCRYAQLRDHR